MTPLIHAIDPGPVQSAIVTLGSDGTVQAATLENDLVIVRLVNLAGQQKQTTLAIEQIASYGMPVGAEIFETVFWSGRFAQVWQAITGVLPVRIPRIQVKSTICHSAKAKDANVRQALIDHFGGPSCIKKGGPLYRVKADEWAALAVAITALNRIATAMNQEEPVQRESPQ